MISSRISRLSALTLSLGGLPLLFAPDIILPMAVPGFPLEGTWVGQLIAAAWLSIALFNWNARNTVLGGIYGRPMVLLNLMVYLISALGLLKVARASGVALLLMAPFAALTIAYGILLWRGPFDRPAAG